MVVELLHRTRSRVHRVYGLLAIAIWCMAAAMFVSHGFAGSLGPIVVVSFVLFAPGLAATLLLRLRGLALSLTVVILTGIAVGVLIPSMLLYAHVWSPRAAFALVAIGTLAAATAGILADAPARRAGGSEVVLTRDSGGELAAEEERQTHRLWA